MRIGNCTPHKLTLIKTNNEIIEVEPSGFVLRVPEKIEKIGIVEGINIVKKTFDMNKITFSDIEKLKNMLDENDIIVVSLKAAELCKYLYDSKVLSKEDIVKVYFVGNSVRDENGRIIGADALPSELYL